MDQDKITWTRVLLNGELVGCLAPEVTSMYGDTPEERSLGRALRGLGYRLATGGEWTRVAQGKKRKDPGYLVFDCGNTLSCRDVRCNSWH